MGVGRKTLLMQDILQGHLARTTPDFPRVGDGTLWQPSWGQKKPKVGYESMLWAPLREGRLLG